MRDIKIAKPKTVAAYNLSQICVTQILTRKEFRRKRRKESREQDKIRE